ncbi:MAG: NAD(P)/FAD-dependent oxidoreductase [Bacteroidia bacterium]
MARNESGTTNNHFGLKGAAEGDRLWSSGNQNEMVADKGYRSILEEKFASVIPDVILNASVFRIDHTLDAIRCDDLNGNSYESDKVIVTVPLGVLKAKLITFVPELSFNKLDAINTLGMGPGMKVILKFSNRFWPEETGSILGGARVPEYWATAVGRSNTDNILTAFVHGDFAASLSAMGSGLVPAVCADLDAMFGGTVATDSLVDSHVEDWGIHPYFQGTYSFPTVGSGNARKLLASPIGNKIFFAGEATHTEGHYATVHGAMETGYRAAQEVVTS